MTKKGIAQIFAQHAAKIKETVSLDAADGGSLDGFVYQRLRDYNLHHIFAELYQQHSDDKRVANLKAVYAIMAYSYDSKWINVDQDRYINKKEILTSLIVDSGVDLPTEAFDDIIFNKDEVLASCINIYIESQKDRKFFAVIALTEHIAFCNRQVMGTKDVTDAQLAQRTIYIGKMNDCEEQLLKMKEYIETTYSNLDEVMHKEGKTPITQNVKLNTYEDWLYAKLNKQI